MIHVLDLVAGAHVHGGGLMTKCILFDFSKLLLICCFLSVCPTVSNTTLTFPQRTGTDNAEEHSIFHAMLNAGIHKLLAELNAVFVHGEGSCTTGETN